jgi:hypothetical protein
MKKFAVAAFLLTMLILPLSAQKKDVLYLKNGSSVYAKLLEIKDNQYKIKTADGSIFIFPSTDIERFANETIEYNGRKNSGFGLALEAGLLIGPQSSEYNAPFSFNILANMTVGTTSIFGLGSGVEYLGQSFTPLFFEYKYLFSQKKTTPFIFMRAGGLFHLSGETESDNYNYTETSYSGGGMLTVGTGISWANDYGDTYLSFAYRYAKTSYTEEYTNSQPVTYRNNYNRLEMKFGFRF